MLVQSKEINMNQNTNLENPEYTQDQIQIWEYILNALHCYHSLLFLICVFASDFY